MLFPERLKLARERLGLSSSALAERTGIVESAIDLLESGQQQPDVDTLISLAEAFDCSLDYLVGRSSSPMVLDRVALYPMDYDDEDEDEDAN